MPVLDAKALNSDPEGLDFLRGVLGVGLDMGCENRRFPIEAWTPKAQASGGPSAASTPDLVSAPNQAPPRFAEVMA